jgi:hypothetical protein
MTEHPRPAPARATGDALEDRIARALRSREPAAGDTAAAAARLEARLAEAAAAPAAPVHLAARRGAKVAAASVAATALVVVGAGAAAASNPYTGFAVAVEGVAHAVGIDWTAMPANYTREQYEAFWASDHADDVDRLSALWGTDTTETKARAGQMLLDGEPIPALPPVDPAEATEAQQYAAFWDAGYTYEDAEQLAALWGVATSEAKALAGADLLEGQTLPVAPSDQPETAGSLG